tara:strand:+ start:691 stop:798 length:108 start_codon:yes stop_codon:yes gene_type:complete
MYEELNQKLKRLERELLEKKRLEREIEIFKMKGVR